MRYFIGDVHGCALEYSNMLELIVERDSRADIYSVGDLINKGPDTVGVLELTKEYGVLPVLGNHELLFLKLMKNSSLITREKDEMLLAAFEGDEKKWAKYISKWPIFRELHDIDVVHAGIDPREKQLSAMKKKIITTIRTWDGTGEDLNNQGYDPAWYDTIDWPKKIVFGHWAQMGLVRKHHAIGLDTGCVYGNCLTAWCPETDEIIQVPSRKVWKNP